MSSRITVNNYSVTGDCSSTSSGAFSFNIGSSAPPFAINWINPAFGTVIINTPPYNYSLTGLSGGTYTFTITDSGIPTYTSPPINLYISTGTCVSIDSIENTTCNLDNGSLTASTSTLYGPYAEFYLYETTSGYITSAQTNSQTMVFNSLSAGTYYVIGDDGGGCTGMSESCIVKSSTTLTYDLYIVDDANCAGSGSGAVYVTNLNGTPPYTYFWSPGGETTSYITGKTSGTYSVIVTDSSNCSVTDSAIITNVPPIGIGLITSVSPTCFSNNGSITVTVTGGTPPYYFSGSNGDSIVTVGQTYTFSGLASGFFEYKITDLGFCVIVGSVPLISPTGFNVININTINSQCSNGQGQIDVEVAGGVGNYVYTLVDSTSTIVESAVVPNTFYTFQNLYSDTYQLTISGGGCVYTTSVTVNNNEFLNIDFDYTGATCDSCNGAIELFAIGGFGNYDYTLVGPSYSQSQLAITSTATTFNGLCPGSYIGSIKDRTTGRCTVFTNVIIPTPPNVNFSLGFTNPSPLSNNGTITALITNGTPPFTLNWSSNVNGQTGITVSNLSAGTYTLQVTDDNGCTLIRAVDLVGYVPLSSYQIYQVCSDDFANTGLLLTKGPKQMLNEGFYDLTSGDTNCILNSAYFTAIVTVGSETKTNTFYTGYNLNDYPSDGLWTDTIENLLLSFDGITGVTTNIEDNTIKITTPCFTLDNSQVKIDMLINYDISCESIEPPVPCTCYALKDLGGLPGAQEVTFTNCYTSEEQTIQFAGIDGLPSKFPYFCSQTKPIRYDGLTANTFYISASTCDNCCRCYIMSGNSTGIDPTGTTYQYLDCNGVSNVVDLAPGEELSVCASVIPWRLSTDNIGNIYSNSGSGGANYFPLCTGSPPSCPT